MVSGTACRTRHVAATQLDTMVRGQNVDDTEGCHPNFFQTIDICLDRAIGIRDALAGCIK